MDLLISPFKTSPEEEARLKEQAKSFPVTKLPYAGERRSLKFDRLNFRPLKRPSKNLPSNLGKARLSFTDYQNGMHMQIRASAHDMRLYYTPEFSLNDELLRLALAQQTYTYVVSSWRGVREFFGGSRRVPQELVDNRELLEKLAAVALDRKRKTGDASISAYRHVLYAEKFHGYLAFRASVAYQAWREAKDATTIAAEMGIPQSSDLIRQILCRLCWTARKLGLKTFTPHPTCQTHVWKLDYDKRAKETRKYPEPTWKSQMSIEEAVERLISGAVTEDRDTTVCTSGSY